MRNPRIIVLSDVDAKTFDWASDGWNTIKQSTTEQAQKLMREAQKAIKAGKNVSDVVDKLKEAGFEVEWRHK